jgi:hypothetical protein
MKRPGVDTVLLMETWFVQVFPARSDMAVGTLAGKASPVTTTATKKFPATAFWAAVVLVVCVWEVPVPIDF